MSPTLKSKREVLEILQELQRLQGLQALEPLKELFWSRLSYDRVNTPLSRRGWTDTAKDALAEDPIVWAQGGDGGSFKILYARLASDRLPLGMERPVVTTLLRDHPYALFVFSNDARDRWHFVSVKYDDDVSKRRLFRRITVSPEERLRTAAERLTLLDLEDVPSPSPLAIQERHDDAFDVEKVTKQFFKEIANWYFWALKHIQFPKDAPKEADGHDHISTIRLITRLIFCWFVKEKGLIPGALFDERALPQTLNGFAPGKNSDKDSVFYKAILQNLFFATLNTEMDKRAWAREEQNFMAHSLYRHKDCFHKPGEALELFKNIPFLNGGLFECLDKDFGEGKNPRYLRVDGFSRRPDSQPVVPDFLFFAAEREVDLSADYGEAKYKRATVRGLIHTLNRYNFTVMENTPLDQEVALDPELSGKVFENLLAAYNPETGATARKQTGSFYTPREIVAYMVDEALLAYLKTKLKEARPKAGEIEARLRHLFAYNDEPHQFTPPEVDALIVAIDSLKALDPAVGSGAFPMGILHKLVFILGKLDPRNEKWKERQVRRVRDAIATAEKIEEAALRERTVRELEQQIAGVNEAFERNELDYGRKLYLIENCIYGVDIQPIAVQIAKMRFFISLIVDQKTDPKATNLGVRPLPNLETKFVAANTLIGVDRPGQQMLRNLEIDAKEAELRRVRDRHFNARTLSTKAKYREQDARLRAEIAEMLKDDGWDDATARKLASWDPYDQNVSADFFDPEWMFGIRVGFDVAIGNPPYVRVDDIPSHNKEVYRSLYRTTTGKYDLYYLFFEKGFSLLRERAILTYISPNKYCAATSASILRQIVFGSAARGEIVSTSRLGVFEDAANYPIISVLVFGDGNRQLNVREAASVDDLGKSSPKSYRLSFGEFNVLPDCVIPINITQEQVNFALRLRKAFPRLGECLSFSEGLRIPSKYESDKKDDHVIVKQYQFEKWTPIRDGTWISSKHLKGVVGETSNRHMKIIRDKIVLAEDALVITATLDKHKAVPQGGVYFGVPVSNDVKLEYAFGLMNSKLLSALYEIMFAGMHMGGGYLRYRSNFIEELPLAVADAKAQEQITGMVEKILEAKKRRADADVSTLEREIDRRVYALYGLTADEIKLVEEIAK